MKTLYTGITKFVFRYVSEVIFIVSNIDQKILRETDINIDTRRQKSKSRQIYLKNKEIQSQKLEVENLLKILQMEL